MRSNSQLCCVSTRLNGCLLNYARAITRLSLKSWKWVSNGNVSGRRSVISMPAWKRSFAYRLVWHFHLMGKAWLLGKRDASFYVRWDSKWIKQKLTRLIHARRIILPTLRKPLIFIRIIHLFLIYSNCNIVLNIQLYFLLIIIISFLIYSNCNIVLNTKYGNNFYLLIFN